MPPNETGPPACAEAFDIPNGRGARGRGEGAEKERRGGAPVNADATVRRPGFPRPARAAA